MKKPSETQVGGAHYKDFPIQPAEFIHKNGIGFLEGNVIKYVCRHRAKGGKQDLEKALHYLELLIEWSYGVQSLPKICEDEVLVCGRCGGLMDPVEHICGEGS